MLTAAAYAGDQEVTPADESAFDEASRANVVLASEAKEFGALAEPGEFFMVDSAEATAQLSPAPPVPGQTEPYYPAPSEPSAPASEFFMRDDASWSTEPMYEADSLRGPASNTVLPGRYFDGVSDWSSMPPAAAGGPSEGVGGFFDAACCSCQQRWVNWRCGTEHLEGCFPEGFNALSTIRSTWPLVRYNGTLNPTAPIEPGGTSDRLPQKAGLVSKPITELTTNIAVATPGRFPEEGIPSLADVPYERSHLPGTQRAWEGLSYYWDASHLVHQPLYFEDLNLERYGYSYGCAQPFVSAARFFGRVPFLPYAMTVHPHYKSEYALGYGRPGSPFPYVHPVPPASLSGAAVEAGVLTGLFFLIP